MNQAGWLAGVRSRVDSRLERYFEAKRAAAKALTPEAPELVEAVERLTMRGGKRFRPALLAASFQAVDPERHPSEVVDAAAALELLQTYLLIHDDWMDQDEERRSGPAVHAALREAHGGDAHLGASLAVLAGNLASAQAWELLASIEVAEDHRREAIAVFLAIHQEVVFGQQLDLLASERVSLMQRLKTGSYTVRGPLLLGGALAGASRGQRCALEAFGAPLGEAFQIRDDLLGTFGDPAATGKPVDTDLRAGKRTALVRAAEERANPDDLSALRAAFGHPEASAEAIERARRVLADCGAKEAVEARLSALLAEAKLALEGAPLHVPVTETLRELADLLAVRDR